MARLPVVGSDDGAWGTILNDYLEQQHGAGGEHLAITIPDTTQAASGILFGGDTKLYRSAADTLKTDDAFVATGTAIASNFKRGTGTPEGSVTGVAGDIYQRTDGSTGTTLYIKESGAGNTGWVAVAAGAGSSYYQTLKEGGTPITQRAGIDFTANDFDLTDDSGNNETDVALASNVARKNLDNSFSSSQSITNNGGKTTLALSDTTANVGLTIGGDTNLYRSAANTLKTDDMFHVVEDISAAGSNKQMALFKFTSSGGLGSTYITVGNVNRSTDIEQNSGGGGPFRYGTYMDSNIVNSYDASAGAYGNINFVTGNVGGLSIAMTIGGGTQKGNVGIGVTSAIDSKLTFAAATTAAGGILFGSDTNLYRSAANVLATDDTFHIRTGGVLRLANPGNTEYVSLNFATVNSINGLSVNYPLHIVETNGRIQFGAAGDTNLYRSSADTLKTDDAFIATGTATASNIKRGSGSPESAVTGNVGDVYQRTDGGSGTTFYIKESGTGNTGWVAVSSGGSISYPLTHTGSLSTDETLNTKVTGDSNNRYTLTAGGILGWGSGSATQDTNLYRAAADSLATDDSFMAGGTITGSNVKQGAGSPEGAVTGVVGDVYQRTDGATGTALYIKESGSGNTGWVAIAGATSESGVYTQTFGDASTTTYTITHNLGSKDVFVGVYQLSDGAEIDTTITRATVNAVTVGFTAAPGVDTMRVIVAGAYDDGAAGGGGQPDFPITQDAASATTDDLLRAKLAGDTQYRFVANSDGMMEWGLGGTTPADTNLYRTSADTLKTDDALEVTGNISAGNITATPGADKVVKATGSGKLAVGWVQEVLGITDLSNVTISSPASGQVLKYNGTVWAEDYLTETVSYSESENLTVKTGKHRFYVEDGFTIIGVRASVGTAPTGASILVDVNKNGTTIFSTQSNRPTITASSYTATTAAIDVTSLSATDYLSVDIDQIGSSIPGADLTVQVLIRSSG